MAKEWRKVCTRHVLLPKHFESRKPSAVLWERNPIKKEVRIQETVLPMKSGRRCFCIDSTLICHDFWHQSVRHDSLITILPDLRWKIDMTKNQAPLKSETACHETRFRITTKPVIPSGYPHCKWGLTREEQKSKNRDECRHGGDIGLIAYHGSAAEH